MSVTLGDLTVMRSVQVCNCSDPKWCNRNGNRYRQESQPASIEDIVEVLRAEGVGEEVEAIQTNMGVNPMNRPWVTEPGRYLVIPLDTPKT